MYEKLLFPIKIGLRTIKNKIVAAPNPSFLCDDEGNLTPQFFSYYKEMIDKSAGMFIIEGSAISKEGRGWHNQCIMSENLNFLGISELVVKMRNQDCLPMIQLYHGGINAISGAMNKLYGPSKIASKKISGYIQELTETDIDTIVNQYKKAATLAWNSGFSGVEINAAEGSLLHQFLSPITNKRTDLFAFGYNNGILILRKVISAIKEAASDLLICVKLSIRDLIPGGAGLKNSIEIAKELKTLGIGLFHVTEGLKIGDAACLHPYLRNNPAPAPFADDALVFRTETKCQVILSTGMRNPEIAEKALGKDSCDFISLSRSLNCEPEWIDMAITNQPIEFYKKCKRCMLCLAASKGCILRR